MAGDNSVIIKKVKKVSGGGHHGGAWKVAYADFVTAMMAFFLLLWLVSQVPADKLAGIADYFTPTTGLTGKVGDSGKGGQGRTDQYLLKKGGSVPNIVYGAPDNLGDIQKAPESNIESDMEYEGAQSDDEPEVVEENEGVHITTTDKTGFTVTEYNAIKIEEELEQMRFQEIQEELKKQFEEDEGLKEFSQNLKVDQTEQGLRIQVTDIEGFSMFSVGSPQLKIQSEPILAKISEIIQGVDNKIAIIGHTDSLGYGAAAEYTNWELSADRANASRRFLLEAGVAPYRIHKVEGMADRAHFLPNRPNDPQNRRISIILMKKSLAPVDPPKSAPETSEEPAAQEAEAQ